MSLVRSYWPVGGARVRLTPRIVGRGARRNSPTLSARPPSRLTDSLTRASARPERDTLPLVSPTRPDACAHACGSTPTSSAVRPKRLIVLPAPMASVFTDACASSIGSEGSTTTPPVERPAATTTKLTPIGDAEYARGSISWPHAAASARFHATHARNALAE